MINYKYKIVYSKQIKKSLKKILKQGKDLEELLDIVDILATKKNLDFKYRNHKLINDKKYTDCYECHIRPDWLLIYKYIDDKLLLLLCDTGTHSELFNK